MTGIGRENASSCNDSSHPCLCGRRCLVSILNNTFGPGTCFEKKYKFSPSGTYYVPPAKGYESYVAFIKDLPVEQPPEAFGMHDNVDISKDLQETKQLFDSCLSTMGEPKIRHLRHTSLILRHAYHQGGQPPAVEMGSDQRR